jgi:hypothetical protein
VSPQPQRRTLTGPDIAPAHGLRAGNGGFFIVTQTTTLQETIMRAFSWLRDRTEVGRRSVERVRAKAKLASRLGLQVLEDRSVPAVVPVTSVLDDGSPGTLRWAVSRAGDGDTIQFTPALHGDPIVLTQGVLALNHDVTIRPLKDATQEISGGYPGTWGGIFLVEATVTMSNLTISAGRALSGGAILNGGTLTIADCTVSGNTAYFGGAIDNGGTLTIIDSTLSGNSGSYGGAIDNGGTLTIIDSTLSDNSATYGGAIWNAFQSTLAISGTTLSGNAAARLGGAIYNEGATQVSGCTLSDNSATWDGGGGIFSGDYYSATLTVSGSTFSDNTGFSIIIIAGGYTDGGGNTFS